ncbi:MAG: cell division protein ZapA [Clostridia bacterium]|nr:cell division protein ZapA [Clostridia bacterium]
MEKRNVTIFVAGKPCSFMTTDSEEYIRRLEAAANDVVKKTAQATHRSLQSSTLLSVVTLADQLLRAQDSEKQEAQEPPAQKKRTARPRKQPASKEPSDQMSIWDVMDS